MVKTGEAHIHNLEVMSYATGQRSDSWSNYRLVIYPTWLKSHLLCNQSCSTSETQICARKQHLYWNKRKKNGLTVISRKENRQIDSYVYLFNKHMRSCHKENQLFLINFQSGRFEKWWQANTHHASSLCVCLCSMCVCVCCLFRLHPSPPSSHLQAENCTSSNCLTFYGSEIVSLSLMDNDGASPCYVNLCDNETTEQPRRSTGGSWEKADNPGRVARSCLTTRPRAPRSVTPSAAHPHGRQGGEGGVGVTAVCCCRLRFHIPAFDLRPWCSRGL